MVDEQLPTSERNAADRERRDRGAKHALPPRRGSANPLDEARLRIPPTGQTLTRDVSEPAGRAMQQLPEQCDQ
jgi:hypothetical protein